MLSGLSATWLYGHMRERPHDNEYDDVKGEPVGHFVTICGYVARGERFLVVDPSPHAAYGRNGRYTVLADRLIHSILLGDVTYDSVLLELDPQGGKP